MRAFRVIVAAMVVEGCFVGRDLSYVDDGKSTSAAGTQPGVTTDNGTLPPPSPDRDAVTPDSGSTQKDAGAKPPPSPSGDCVYGELEPNDQAQQANDLVTGSTCGQLVVGSDVDWYLFDMGGGGTVTISFQAEADAYIAMVGIVKSDSYTGKAGSRIQFYGEGKYYVRIYSFGTVAQGYQIALE